MNFRRFLFLWLLPFSALLAQDDDIVHPELRWHTIETEHFLVHFHEGAEWSARRVAEIAERIYHPITELYQHRPDQKVNIVIRDHDDYSNGAAFFYENRIEIWAPALDFELRGTHPWLENVVTHEFTHIVQIQTSMKLGRTVPAIYLQWLGYEAERRPDVLYGFPNVLVSYPLSAFVIPSWFAEGVAQYNHPDLLYDTWDAHRDMILRTALLDNRVLSWEEMAVFGKNSLGNESAYNAGFSFVGYIVERFGVEALREISRRLGALHRVTIDAAIEAAVGISGKELYEQWKRAKLEAYRTLVAVQGAGQREGEIVIEEGFGNFYPTFSPDGKKLYYVSTADRDYFSQSSVFEYNLETKASKRIVAGVRSSLSISPDGASLYYAKATRSNPFWSEFFDLYRYDLSAKREVRLTRGQRAMNPRLSPDGNRLVFVTGRDGTTNIAVANTDGSGVTQLTSFTQGEQVFVPVWSPDGSRIAFGFSHGRGQSVAMVDSDGQNFRIVIAGPDARDPLFSADGKRLYFSSDRTGIFNIYAHDVESEELRQVTNVVGGAFLPAVSMDGKLAYALFTSTGYKIAMMDVNDAAREQPRPATLSRARNMPLVHGDAAIAQSKNGNPHPAVREYRNTFTSLSLIPTIRVDNYNPRNKGVDIVKPGLYFTSTDVLGKFALFGGAAVNRKLERDLFLILDYKDRLPPFFQLGLDPALSVELYNTTRTTDAFIDLPPYAVKAEVTYNLLEFNVFLRQRLLAERTDLRLGFTLSRYNADIGTFVNPNDNTQYPSFRTTYLIANTWSAQVRHVDIMPSREREINPVGRVATLRYAYERNRFNPNGDYEVRNGFLVPIYTPFNFHRVELQWNEYIPLPVARHTVGFAFRAGSILGGAVDDFFDFYAGGFTGMRGYPFYALGGNEIASLNISYRFPVWRSINARVLQFYVTKLYGQVFGDIGMAWTGDVPPLRDWKTDAGFELRLETFSFYQYPTRIFFSGAYGFDRFTRTINTVDVTYGREWRFYLGVLFGFEINQGGRMGGS